MANELNLTLVVGGFTTIGGMVYGGYELLKNEPRPVTDLLKIKKRVLIGDSEEELWKQSWGKYIEDHTKTEEVKPTETEAAAPSESPAKPKPKETKKVIDNSADTWGFLNGWTDPNDSRKDKIPEGYKAKCTEINNGEQSGIWTAEYKRFEKYCTKEINPDD